MDSIPDDIRSVREPDDAVIREQALGDFYRQHIDACCARKGGTMKRVLLAGAALLTIAASPAAAITVWQGDLFVIAAVSDTAGACAAVNMSVGNYARGVFRPKGLGDNGTSDLLSWHFSGSSGQIATAANVPLDGATSATVRIIYGSAGFNQFTNWTISGADVTPPAPLAGTATVAVQVTVQDIYSKRPTQPSNCNVTFRGTLAKKP